MRFGRVYIAISAVCVIGLVFTLSPVTYARLDFNIDRSRPEKPVRPDIDRLLRWDHRQDRILVKYKGKPELIKVRIPEGSVKSELKRVLQDANVEYAEPDYIARAFFIPDDSYYGYQWNFNNSTYGGINVQSAWDKTNGSGVIVAIVDTGIAYENYGFWYKQAPDLNGTNFVQGYDFVNNDSHPNDDEGHGTHVAGTVAQTTNNSKGVAGVAFGASLMPVKVLDNRGNGYYSNVADGIKYAADNGAKIINLSLGGDAPSQTLENAVRYAYEKGAVIVAAAGNDGRNSISYPAGYNDYVIAVGATRYDETRAYYSNYGNGLDIVAPGGDLNVDQNGDGYGDGILQQTFGSNPRSFGYYFYQGTSMATPHVSAVAAMIISEGIASTPADVQEVLQLTAEDLGPIGWDSQYGWGLLDAAAAVNYAPSPADNPPQIKLNAPLNNETVSGVISITADASDDNGIDKVEFRIDSVLVGSATTSPYSVQWDSASVSDGLHTIEAKAYDTLFQTSTDSVSITVDNVNDPPVADAGPDSAVSDSDGDNMENITLNGSNSYDPDGSIVSYVWKENSVVLASTSVADVSLTVGVHNIILIVEDDRGASVQDEVVITVLANQAPIANAGRDKTGFIGDSISFSAAGSYDPDGSIVSYQWDFDDGSTAAGVNVSHVYQAIGTYTVTLEVIDNGGLRDSDTLRVTISEAPQAEIIIESITARNIRAGRRYRVEARVKSQSPSSVEALGRLKIFDPDGNSVNWKGMRDKKKLIPPGSSVTYIWSGRTPRRATLGDYVAEVSIFVNNSEAASASTTFNVRKR